MLGRLGGYRLFFIIGAATLVTRAILDSDFRNSTLLYLLVPFGVSILIHELTPPVEGESRFRQMMKHLRAATIVLLATSAILFEGFICVLFFMPIYYLMVLIGFTFSVLSGPGDGEDGGQAGAYAIPLALLFLASEGLTEPTTVQRYREATHVAVLDGTIAALKANMARPVVFTQDRPALLSVFPLPVRIEAASLGEGDIHRLHFVYRRWFFANVHEGGMALRIAEVGADRIRTEIVEDGSYLSQYMKIEGTEIRFTDVGGGRTRVALTVKYRRLLDPYWYFGPLQQRAAEQSAAYFIDTIIARRGETA